MNNNTILNITTKISYMSLNHVEKSLHQRIQDFIPGKQGKLFNIQKAMKYSHISLVNSLVQHDNTKDTIRYCVMPFALKHGSVKILKSLSHFGIYPPCYEHKNIFKNGLLNIIQWISHPDCLDHQLILQPMHLGFAAYFGHLHIIQWILQHTSLKIFTFTIFSALSGGHFHVVQWLLNNCDKNEMYTPQQEDSDSAASSGHLQIVKWIAEQYHIIPSDYAIDYAARKGYSDIIDWYCSTPLIC